MVKKQFDVIVVGAGHAGCEAALACARLGYETLLTTISMDSVAFMPCNPSIGGSSKGHLVKEIDALGGQMGINTDQTFLQSKMLNKSKGPAVHSLRAQADKQAYSTLMRKTLEAQDRLSIRQLEVTKLLVTDHVVTGIEVLSKERYTASSVILCTGTYLMARCLYGDVIENTGPNGLKAANYLTASLEQNGVKMQRFKTGTPARIDGHSIDYDKMKPEYGDEMITPFSFTTNPDDIQKEQVLCYLTYTNERTHKVIRDHLEESPIYAGIIEGIGPRYCPSIEDKVVKFPDKERHQLFIEPEGMHTSEMYISGMSSSMPEAVQEEMYQTIPGLEHARIVRNAYAIEYDCLGPFQLKASLELKAISGLFSAGQFNGSSGYEEAAAQGLMAGINATRYIEKRDPIILDRSQAYIGVLIDDLVSKEIREPYRMMTSRAEYRLLLRQDNADLRLTPIGYEVGLIDEERMQRLLEKKTRIKEELDRIDTVRVRSGKNENALLEQLGSAPIQSGVSLKELIRRPELNYDLLASLDEGRPLLDRDVCKQVDIHIKYEGYIDRQEHQVKEFKRLEKKLIPADISYTTLSSLRLEARQKLDAIRPTNIGQASRISGVTPADIQVLLVYLAQRKDEIDDK